MQIWFRLLRCYFCFSYRHLPNRCDQPRPAFFQAADLDRGTAPIIPLVAPAAATVPPGGPRQGTVHNPRHEAHGASGSSSLRRPSLGASASHQHTTTPTAIRQGKLRPLTRTGPPAVLQEHIPLPNNIPAVNASTEAGTSSGTTQLHAAHAAPAGTLEKRRTSTAGHTPPGKIWVVKTTPTPLQPSASTGGTATSPASGIAEASNSTSTVNQACAPAATQLKTPEPVQPAPPAPSHLAVVPFSGGNLSGSNRKQLRYDHPTTPINLNICDSQAEESPRPAKRAFKPTGAYLGTFEANTSTLPTGPRQFTLEASDSTSQLQIVGGPSRNPIPWDLVPHQASGPHDEAQAPHIQYAWPGHSPAEGESTHPTGEPSGST